MTVQRTEVTDHYNVTNQKPFHLEIFAKFGSSNRSIISDFKTLANVVLVIGVPRVVRERR